MNSQKTITTLSALVAVAALAGCVDHRPIRNGLLDESVYLDKADLTNGPWLFKVTTVKASSPNIVANYVFPGFESDVYFTRLRFAENTLQVVDARKLQVDDPNNPNDDITTATENVLFEFPGKHVDVKLRESLDGERTNFLEENTEMPWQVRQQFKAELEEVTRDPIAAVAWYYADYVADCAQIVSTSLVPGSFELDESDPNNRHMTFVVEVNYALNMLTSLGGCWDMVSMASNTGTSSVQYRFSFLQRGVGDYQPEVIGEKDDVNKKYGSFQRLNLLRDPETGLLDAQSLLHRWDPNRTDPVVYYFNEGFPERFKPAWQEIKTETNRVLEQAGAKLRVDFREWNDAGIARHFGDLRYSFIVWHQDIDTTLGLLGYGPSVSDPRTGEILSANVNLYNIGMDYYRYRIEDYLEEYGASTKPDADKAWEDIACTAGDTRTTAPTEGRLTSTLFGEMRRVMEIDDTGACAADTDCTTTCIHGHCEGTNPADDFIPTPSRSEFYNDYHRILPEMRYAVSWWNPYVYRSGGSYLPIADYGQRMQIEGEFQQSMHNILMNENPYGPVALYTREGIAKQNEFIEQFRAWRKNHEVLQIDRDMVMSSRNVYTYDENDALSAIANGARRCIDYNVTAPAAAADIGCGAGACWRWESDTIYRERIIESVVTDVAIHEFGHTLSLRHNFYGSVDAKHMRPADSEFPAEVTASVMDYLWSPEATGHHRKWGLYDEAALEWIYGTPQVREQVMQEDFLYCTDEHRFFSPLCTAHDLGITPSQIVLNAIELYDWQYKTRNRRAYRTFWDTSSYVGRVYNGIFPLQRMWYMSIYDWGGGGVQDYLKRLDQVGGGAVLTDPEYDEIAQDFYNEAFAANSMLIGYYDAMINQPAAFRNYQTEFDPYYGDVLRLGIITDKLYTTFAFMDLQEVWDYDPNVYDYAAMYDAPFGTRNWTLSQRVLDDMLGANYDTFPWFKYLALNIFGYVTNSNLVGNAELKDRIAIKRYENVMEFELAYGTDVWDQINRGDNPQQIFIHDGEELVYTFLKDRGWHLVASKSRSPVSFRFMQDYNDALNGGASGSLDNYGLKILLAYYEYYNNFVGF